MRHKFRTISRAVLLFISLLGIRFWLSTLFFNADFYNHQAWVNFIKEFGTQSLYTHDFTPWAKAVYPPLVNTLFWQADLLSFKIFGSPSPEILTSFYKLISLIPETALITYFFFKKQKMAAFILFFNPGIFYNTLFWGQTEGAITSLTVLSIFFFFSRYTLFGFIAFTSALLIKQSALAFLPIITILVLKMVPAKNILLAVVISIFYTWIAFMPYADDFLFEPFRFYLINSGGLDHQHLSSVNAYNLWFLLGFNNHPDSLTFLGISHRIWGYTLLLFTLIPICGKLWRQKEITKLEAFTSLGILMLSTFLFTTRMHERHFFPVLIFLIPFALLSRKNFLLYCFLSFYHFLNLYWVWQYPSLPISFFFQPVILNFMTAITIGIFGYITINFLNTRKK